MIDSGALLVDKPAGITSFQALRPLKRYLTGIRVGHAGTLDRAAEGLLVVLFGAMTRLTPLLAGLDKRYRARIRFGIETETDDREGAVSATAPLPDQDRVFSAIERFKGRIMQRPPSYSALHVDGERAYRRVLKGEQLELPPREVTIYDLRIRDVDLPYMVLDVHCSKGTYIRALARDMGRHCGSVASLDRLERLAIGPFHRADAINIQQGDIAAHLAAHLFSAYRLMQSLDMIACVRLRDDVVRRVLHGGQLDDSMLVEAPERDGFCALFSADERFVALCMRTEGRYSYQFVASTRFSSANH